MMIDRQTTTGPMESVRNAGSLPQPVRPDGEPGFDDGLVHDHGWACRERGAPQSPQTTPLRH